MPLQSEAQLEKALLQQLTSMGYASVQIRTEEDLLRNLKRQLEKHNGLTLTEGEFKQVLNYLNKGNAFQRAHLLRDRFQFTREDGSTAYVRFLNTAQWCQNEYQVTNQVSQSGKYHNRYDVTLLINGLPLVHIELKRRGMGLKSAFNQINRYQRHSFDANYGLYLYTQIFIISNGVNTRYFANNRHQTFKQTFTWAGEDNQSIDDLHTFAEHFLEKCHLSKMICKYIVLHQSSKVPMVLRSYQYHAVEAIIDKVKNSSNGQGGYIWHTTGSGKTLTSFKASQIVKEFPHVHKVVFVVDRNDLDYQTIKEFNYFAEGSIDGTDNTRILVDQFLDRYRDAKGEPKPTKLIVTTIQKLNVAITRQRYQKHMEALRDQRIVFIFDECHRSQFGKTHTAIIKFFTNHQLFGFTGTPILEENIIKNELGQRTTATLFGPSLHRYVISDAIRDENVLRFSVEYVGPEKDKQNSVNQLEITPDKVADYIIKFHDRKTHNRRFTAIFCVSSVKDLIEYYDLFQHKKDSGQHDLRIVTVFSYGQNEDDREADGLTRDEAIIPAKGEAQAYSEHELTSYAEEFMAEYEPERPVADLLKGFRQQRKGGDMPPQPSEELDAFMRFLAQKQSPKESIHPHSREKLDEYIQHYNQMYGTNHSAKDTTAFYTYYKDISRRIKEREKSTFDEKDRVDILLVVNMFLTGFDAKKVNTLYVDKNLRYHGLIQAYSRTNRILDNVKSHGIIVVFRDLKAATDEAVRVFSDKDAKDAIFLEPYEDQVEKFKVALEQFKEIAPTFQDVNHLPSETEELEFIQAYREALRIKNVLQGFSEFTFDDLGIDEQEFADYGSKYLDLRDKARRNRGEIVGGDNGQTSSLLNDIDFELELLHRDEINVAYILKLLGQLKDSEEDQATKDQKHEQITKLLTAETKLRSKRELIEDFIQNQLPHIEDADDIPDAFDQYWQQQRQARLQQLCQEENLNLDDFEALINNYAYTGSAPRRNDLLDALQTPVKLSKRKPTYQRLLTRFEEFIETFDEGLGS